MKKMVFGIGIVLMALMFAACGNGGGGGAQPAADGGAAPAAPAATGEIELINPFTGADHQMFQDMVE